MALSIDFSQQVKEVLNRNNIQVRSLALIDPQVKAQFFLHRKKAILLIRNKVYEREINSQDAHAIDVFDPQLTHYLKKGQLVLVVLPTGGAKRYVLQASVDNIFVDRFRLVTLDPRKNKRFSFFRPVGVKLRLVNDASVIRIQTGEVRAQRMTNGIILDDPPDNGGGPATSKNASAELDFTKQLLASDDGKEGPSPVTPPAGATSTPLSRSDSGPVALFAIRDVLCRGESDEQAEDYVRLEGQPPVEGIIVDISCGGMCISHSPGSENHICVDQLLAVECVLAKDSAAADAASLHLFVFAVVRNVRERQGQNHANLQFLSALPKAIQRGFFPERPDDADTA